MKPAGAMRLGTCPRWAPRRQAGGTLSDVDESGLGQKLPPWHDRHPSPPGRAAPRPPM